MLRLFKRLVLERLLKWRVGTYTIDNPITTLTNNLTLEGGFDPANGWKKTSLGGSYKNLSVQTFER
jgi:hypothetical protein